MEKIALPIRLIISTYLILSLVFVFSGGFSAQVAHAANLTSKTDTLSSLKASTAADHTILFTTPTGVAAGETIELTFTSFTVGASLDFEDLDMSIEAAGGDGVCDTGDTEKTLAATASGAAWGAVRTSATVITIDSGTDTITAGDEVCIEIGTGAETGATGVEQITNPTAGSYDLAIAGTMTDSGETAIEILTDDQVAVTAVVDESLTLHF
jgi:hypothetical protein